MQEHTQTETANERIIDLDKLVSIIGDEQAVKEFMPSYLDDSKKHFEKLTRAIEAGDAETVASSAHAVKGTGRNLGAQKLMDTAYVLESAGRKNDVEAAAAGYDDLKREFEKVVEFLSRPDWLETAKQRS